MSRYVGLLMLVLTASLAVNFAADALYERAIAAQIDEADDPAPLMATAPARLPLTGLIQAGTGRTPVQTAQLRLGGGAARQH